MQACQRDRRQFYEILQRFINKKLLLLERKLNYSNLTTQTRYPEKQEDSSKLPKFPKVINFVQSMSCRMFEGFCGFSADKKSSFLRRKNFQRVVR